MLTRIGLVLVGVILFLVESEFAMFSPIEIGGQTLILVPRFLVLYLLFLAIYFDRKRAIIYGFVFGLCYDVFYINIIGLYTFLYPALCFVAAWCAKRIHPHLLFSMVLAILLISILEFIIYEFFFMIQFTTMALQPFLLNRLVPTIVINLLFLFMLAWIFRYLINARILQRAQQHS
jgi:rod shape-determining protein MreD